MSETKLTTPIKAIRAKCIDCCCGDTREVRLCPAEDCPLHPFRYGKNPNLQQAFSEETLEKYRQRMKTINENRKKEAESC